MDTCVYSFTGHYGSGKTEAAVNFAVKLKRQGRNTALIDLDIVNPFFRSADARELLETLGIRTEFPLYANTNVDVPALTGVMGALIRDEAYDVVLDVGGDDLGAKALGRYREDILSRKKHLQFFVMNPNRPFTKDPPEFMMKLKRLRGCAAMPWSEIRICWRIRRRKPYWQDFRS